MPPFLMASALFVEQTCRARLATPQASVEGRFAHNRY
jgi:hypothetical protein